MAKVNVTGVVESGRGHGRLVESKIDDEMDAS